MMNFKLSMRRYGIALGLAAGLCLSRGVMAQQETEPPPQPRAPASETKADGEANGSQTDQPNAQAPSDAAQGKTRAPDAPKRRPIELGVLAEPSENRGVVVRDIRPGSAADQAGILRGDYILSIGKQPVNSLEDLARAVGERSAGDEVMIEVWRNGASQQITAKLQEAKSEQGASEPQPRRHTAMRPNFESRQDNAPWIGIWLHEGQDAQGVKVRHVFPSGPAARAGLREGDVIASVADTRVASAQELVDQIAKLKPNETTSLTVLRGGQPVALSVVIGQRSEFGVTPPIPTPQDKTQDGAQLPDEDPDDFGSVPDHAMMLEQHRRFAEQHERIENLILELKEEVRQLREELRQRDGKPAAQEAAPANP